MDTGAAGSIGTSCFVSRRSRTQGAAVPAQRFHWGRSPHNQEGFGRRDGCLRLQPAPAHGAVTTGAPRRWGDGRCPRSTSRCATGRNQSRSRRAGTQARTTDRSRFGRSPGLQPRCSRRSSTWNVAGPGLDRACFRDSPLRPFPSRELRTPREPAAATASTRIRTAVATSPTSLATGAPTRSPSMASSAGRARSRGSRDTGAPPRSPSMARAQSSDGATSAGTSVAVRATQYTGHHPPGPFTPAAGGDFGRLPPMGRAEVGVPREAHSPGPRRGIGLATRRSVASVPGVARHPGAILPRRRGEAFPLPAQVEARFST